MLQLIEEKKFPNEQEVLKTMHFEDHFMPFMVLSISYNLNSRLCDSVSWPIIYHFYHHKPWMPKHMLKIKECTKLIIAEWKVKEAFVLDMIKEKGISLDHLRLTDLRNHLRIR